MPHLRVDVAEGRARRVVAVDSPVFTIGRRRKSHLSLSGSEVSRDHARILNRDGQFVILDHESRHGTFVNGRRIAEQPLSHGDRIGLGRHGAELTFTTDDADDRASSSSGAHSSPVENVRQMAALFEGMRALGSGHGLNDLLQLVLDAAIDATGAERGCIMLADSGDVLRLTRARARGRVTLPGTTWDTSLKIPEQVFTTGEMQVVRDLCDADVASEHQGTVALGIRHVLCAPLRVVRYLQHSDAAPEQKRIGVLYLDGRDKRSLLSATTRAGVETLAAEAAVAIDNARLYRETLEKARLDRELRIAAEIQQGLMPAPRYLREDLEVVAKSLPCRLIGGDFFEFIELPSGDFGFALGDVAGKGPAAALLAAALQGMLAAYAALEGGPAATVTRVNQALMRRADRRQFVTMWYGVVSPDGRLTYCNAGHTPPMLFANGSVTRLHEGGLVLGLFGDARYEEATVTLNAADVLAVFSDGVTEAVDLGSREFGDEGIIASMEKHLHIELTGLLDRVLSAVSRFSEGAEQGDDVTALVLRHFGCVHGSSFHRLASRAARCSGCRAG